MGWVLLALAILAAAIMVVRGFIGGLTRPHGQFVDFHDNGSFNQEIVGEASYQAALLSIAGRGEVRHTCKAILALEDTNPHDENAVAVYIDGEKVGYLSRSDAKRYRKNKAPRGAHGACPAVIVGGGRGKNLGVWLDIRI